MKQDAWEERVSEQLRERRIEPRPELWEQLNEQLEELPVPPKKSAVTPYLKYAAVAVIALIIASLIWTSSKDVANPLPEVVVEPSEPVLPLTEENQGVPAQETEVVIAVEDHSRVEEQSSNLVAEEIQESELVLVEVESEKQPLLDKAIKEKTQGLLAEVLAMQDSGRRVTDSEVDSLLRKAQAEILAERQFAESVGSSTDAMALLAEAEFELYNDQNFRDRLFDSLKESFLRVSTAVAQRNK